MAEHAQWTFHSRELTLIVDSASGAFSVIHTPSGTEWPRDPWWGEVGEVRGGVNGPSYSFVKSRRIALYKHDRGFRAEYRDFLCIDRGEPIPGSYARVGIFLEGDNRLLLTLEAIEMPEAISWRFVIFPARFGALRTHKDTGYLVDPQCHGAILPSHEVPSKAPEIWRREDRRRPIFRSFAGGNALQMAAMVKERGAFLFTPDRRFADSGYECLPNHHYFLRNFLQNRHTGDPRIAANSPLHEKCLGVLETPRRFTYHFLRGGYVELAKAYRKYFESTYRVLPTFRDRARDDRRIERFIGAPFISIYGGYPHYRWHKGFEYSYRALADMMRDMKTGLGMDKAIFHVWGMYEHTSADPFPWASRPGTEQDLRDMVRTADRLGYLFMPYSYYTPYQPDGGPFDWEKKARMSFDYMYAEDVHKWNRISSRYYVEYAKKHVAKLKSVGIHALQMDIICAGWFREEDLASPPRTREDDFQDRLNLYKYLRSEGLLVVAEAFKDWALGYVDLFEGPGNLKGTYTDGFPIPLTSLAFHDVVHHCRFVGDPYNACWDVNSDYVKKSLQDLCWGCPPIYVFAQREYQGWRRQMRESYRLGAVSAQRVGYDAMVDHRFLADDFQSESSLFASGVKIDVNHGVQAVETEGAILPGRGFRVMRDDRILQEGVFRTAILPPNGLDDAACVPHPFGKETYGNGEKTHHD